MLVQRALRRAGRDTFGVTSRSSIPFAGRLHRPLQTESPFAKRRRRVSPNRPKAVSRGDINELELQIAVVNQEMMAAATEERFQDAAKLRDRLEGLRLKQRCMQLQHTEELRRTICHHLGQVIKHKRYNYRGVIFGVHSSCQASETWIQTMGVDRLPKGRHQPFYQVLVDERDRPGGMITYVAQENIDNPNELMEEESPIVHHQIAQMFDNFDAAAQRYSPNSKLVSMYPDSLEARSKSLQKDLEPGGS